MLVDDDPLNEIMQEGKDTHGHDTSVFLIFCLFDTKPLPEPMVTY